MPSFPESFYLTYLRVRNMSHFSYIDCKSSCFSSHMLTPHTPPPSLPQTAQDSGQSRTLFGQLQGIAMHILLPTPLMDFQASEMRLVSLVWSLILGRPNIPLSCLPDTASINILFFPPSCNLKSIGLSPKYHSHLFQSSFPLCPAWTYFSKNSN